MNDNPTKNRWRMSPHGRTHGLTEEDHHWTFDSSVPVLDVGTKGVRSYTCPCGARASSDMFTGEIDLKTIRWDRSDSSRE